mmetsp:Transcript_14727/g.21034  ORF Transcript_14727/g.21034 Transcript_14727/m.21034 type:complete len:88 (+) Transcript_14727:445-708(+)
MFCRSRTSQIFLLLLLRALFVLMAFVLQLKTTIWPIKENEKAEEVYKERMASFENIRNKSEAKMPKICINNDGLLLLSSTLWKLSIL